MYMRTGHPYFLVSRTLRECLHIPDRPGNNNAKTMLTNYRNRIQTVEQHGCYHSTYQ